MRKKAQIILLSMLLMAGCTKNLLDSGGTGLSENQGGFAPGLDPFPQAFLITQATPGNQKITLTWSTSVSASSYDLMYRLVGTIDYTVVAKVQSPHIVTGLINNRVYEFKVRAINIQGNRDSGVAQASPRIGGVSATELISASVQNKLSTGGKFIVQGTLASPTDKLSLKTPHGYEVQMNVQGQISSDH